ncbi:MAG: N-acetyl-gamma-glutamyl-phosphate reductase [Planctomycetota bacterium]
MKRVAIVGASGYTGQELLRLLRRHPSIEVARAMTARRGVRPEPPAIPGETPIEPLDFGAFRDSDGVFLCTPHGAAAEAADAALEAGCRVVDLSADFRLRSARAYEEAYGEAHPAPHLLPRAVYGLSEHERARIEKAHLVANPGCYPTSILLPLLPLREAGLLDESAAIVADSKSGISGAGKTPSERTHFGSVQENLAPYGLPFHRHLAEIRQEAGTEDVAFVPHLVPLFRGMLSTLYLRAREGAGEDDARACLIERYRGEPFVKVRETGLPELRHVRHTNECHIAVSRSGPLLVVVSAIDNLGKGASGQALQNMNLMLGLPEAEGLT